MRTCVGRNVNLADYTDRTPQQLRERAKSADPRAKEELLEVYGLFASEYDYRAVDPHQLPYGRAIRRNPRKRRRCPSSCIGNVASLCACSITTRW
jgi:hypothetical protein